MDSSAFVDGLAPHQAARSSSAITPASRSGHSTGSTSPVENRPSSLRFAGTDNRASPSSSPTPDQSSSSTLPRSAVRRRQFHDGPPTSGNSTPLREPIIESPTGDSFTGFHQHSTPLPPGLVAQVPAAIPALSQLQIRRRAGTLPSRLPGSAVPPKPSLSSLHQPRTGSGLGQADSTENLTPPHPPIATTSHQAAPSILSVQPRHVWPARFRSDSLPSNRLILSALGHNTQPDRASPLANQLSPDSESGPTASSKQALLDGGVRTLDYLGLMDPSLVMPYSDHDFPSLTSLAADLPQQHQAGADQKVAASRFRSYSVNAKEKYADPSSSSMSSSFIGMGPDANPLSIQEAIMQHNRDVEAFLRIKSTVARPRSKTVAATLGTSSLTLENVPPMTMEQVSIPPSTETLNASESAHLASTMGSMQGQTDQVGDIPTRAIWLGHIPSSTTVSSLNVIFSRFGPIESSRVLTHKNCGFVNFVSVESAIRARAQLNGKEIFLGAGPTRIGFAKAPSRSNTPAIRQNSTGSDSDTNFVPSAQDSDVLTTEPVVVKPLALEDTYSSIMSIVVDLGASPDEQENVQSLLESAVSNGKFSNDIANIPEPRTERHYDATKLREIRKRIDNHTYTQTDVETIATSMLPEISELASDYLGNTVVQKLFEHCSDSVRQAMLTEIAPNLAGVGVHKNGTWAAQKIIDVSCTTELMSLISDALRPYAVSLFLDQFGNYVIQGCLRYPSPLNDFIFEAMVANLADLAHGRFGARAMRACLESHHTTRSQQMMVAAAIAIHSVRLATNGNGALLLTWFLDTCTLSNRRTVLAPFLIPHLHELCTHRVAYLTVLKLINQRIEPEARSIVLNALFFSPNNTVLENILSDPNCGPTFIFKVIASPFFDDEMRTDVVQNIRTVLQRIKAQPNQGYKRLMDEVGLSTRHSSNQTSGREPKPTHISGYTKRDDSAGPHRPNVPMSHPSSAIPPGYGEFMGDGSLQMAGNDLGSSSAFPSFPEAGMYGTVSNPAHMPFQQPVQAGARPGFYPQMMPIGPMNHPGFNAPNYPPSGQMYQYPVPYAQSQHTNMRRGGGFH